MIVGDTGIPLGTRLQVLLTVPGHPNELAAGKRPRVTLSPTIVLKDGETLRGTVEWYDRDCIKLTRFGSPNLLIYKQVIKYVYKDGEEAAQGGTNGQ